MNTASFNVTDLQGLSQILDNLSSKDLKKLHKNTLLNIGKILVNQTKKNLRGVTNRSRTTNSVTSKGTKRGSLESGITNKVWKSQQGLTVTILGDYRLKWFQDGTKERITKTGKNKRYQKPKSTGAMKASKFFTNAIENKKDDAVKEVEKAFIKNVNKIWQKQQVNN